MPPFPSADEVQRTVRTFVAGFAQMKVSDESSKRYTKALTDAGNVLSVPQRQAFFKAWGERHHGSRKG